MKLEKKWLEYYLSLERQQSYATVKSDAFFEFIYQDLVLPFTINKPKVCIIHRHDRYQHREYDFVVCLVGKTFQYRLLDCVIHVNEEVNLFVIHGPTSAIDLTYCIKNTIPEDIRRIKDSNFYKNLLMIDKIDNDKFNIL